MEQGTVKMKYPLLKTTLSCLAIAVLSACGDSSSNVSENELGAAPIAFSDVAAVNDNQSVTIAILDNDRDPDGDSLRVAGIAVEPEFGTAEVVDNQIVYTPNVDYFGKDNFRYILSDGSNTTTAGVTVTVGQTLTIAGSLVGSSSGSIMDEATISVNLGEQTNTATADENGQFEVPVLLTDPDQLVVLKAVGSEEIEQSHVVLLKALTNPQQLFNLAGADKVLTNIESSHANISHLTTAAHLLALEQGADKDVDSSKEYLSMLDKVNAQELLDTSAFVKLLVDNNAYTAINGQSIVELLNSSNGSSIASSIQSYLQAVELINPLTGLSEQYQSDLQAALHSTLTDNQVTLPITAAQISSQPLVVQQGSLQTGWISPANEVLSLGESTQSMWSPANAFRATESLQWQIVDNQLLVETGDKTIRGIALGPAGSDNVSDNSLFWGEEVFQKLEQVVADEGLTNGFLWFDYEVSKPTRKYTALNQGDTRMQVVVETTESRELLIPEELAEQWGEPNPIASRVVVETINVNMASPIAIEDMAGTWIMPLYQTVEGDDSGVSRIVQDRLTINESGGVEAQYYAEALTLEQIDGVIHLASDSQRFEIRPIQLEGDQYLVVVSQYTGETMVRQYTQVMTKVDDEFAIDDFAQSLVTTLPSFVVEHTHSFMPSNWEDDKLNLGAVKGMLFQNEGQFVMDIQAEQDASVVSFRASSENEQWKVGEDAFQFSLNLEFENELQSTSELRVFNWEPISQDQQGRLIIRETIQIGVDSDDDNQLSEEEISNTIYPQIKVVTFEDMNDWPELLEAMQLQLSN